MPIYALYALLFVDRGLSDGQVSLLFAIWSVVGIVAEVPTGALADRYSRRGCLVAAGGLQAAAYALWISVPDFVGFAGGFALWGLGGALASGALDALLFDGLAEVGAEAHFGAVLGRVTAAGLLAQLPAAVAATVLFRLGGYALVAWVSVGVCLTAAALSTRLPEARRGRPTSDDDHDGDEGLSYLATLRAGVIAAAGHPVVRRAVLAVVVVAGIDTLDEYFPLMAHDWGVPTRLVPFAVLGIPLAGAIGAALGGRGSRLGRRRLALLLAAGAVTLGGAGLAGRPAGLVAVAVFYGVYRMVLVIVQTRLQERIDASSRATVASVAAFGTEISVFGLYAAWAVGGLLLIAAIVAIIAILTPRLLAPPPTLR